MIKRFKLCTTAFSFLLFSYCHAQQVSVNKNVLKFTTIGDYESFAEDPDIRGNLPGMAQNSSTFTSLEEANTSNGIVEDTLYPEFLTQVLNDDHIVEIGSFLVKVDLENNRGMAIKSTEPDAYNTLKNDVLTAANLIVFDDEEDNAMEVLELAESSNSRAANYIPDNGSISLNNHGPAEQEFIEASNFVDYNKYFYWGCPGAERQTQKIIYGWDQVNNPQSSCIGKVDHYVMDCKAVYQKAFIYFSLQGKMKSYKGCAYTNWNTQIQTHTDQLFIESQVKYIKRCGSEVRDSKSFFKRMV